MCFEKNCGHRDIMPNRYMIEKFIPEGGAKDQTPRQLPVSELQNTLVSMGVKLYHSKMFL